MPTRKRAHGVLDYDDLISTALDLLHRPGIAPWVLFKLDGGLDHILIDEAQDTNPEQWQIVAALAEEFFAGEGAGDRPRTIFAVGDAKQSIYSFQRADPRAFLAMREHFERRVSDARQEWRVVPLEVSFRSTEPVLRAIDAVFRHEAARDGVALDGGEIRHIASRAGHAGVVELWPPVVGQPEEPPDPMALPVIRQRTTEPRTRLANAIAATIAALARERGVARGLRPPDPAGRRHGAGAAPQRVCRRAAARAQTTRHSGRRGRPPHPDRAAGRARPGGARPVLAVAGR